VIRSIISKAPTVSSAEVPILRVLSDAPQKRLPAKLVIETVGASGKYFEKLCDNDLAARYVGSHRKIIEIIIRFARKNLVMAGMILSPGAEAGVWEITPKGLERIRNSQNWRAKYSVHEGIIIEET
jgi:hypothetical protein